MKIALVAPSPVPFALGGAETLWRNLAERINSDTPHVAELIKLPAPERSLADLLRSYEAFSTLDLRHFDAVITGKYPAWMIDHPNHIGYMLHRLRGLYDTYPLTGQPITPPHPSPATAALLDFMARRRGQRVALPEFFARARHVLATAPEDGVFPGPLARQVVHWLDEIGLAPRAIRRYAAISRTVAAREGYFPPGQAVTVAYPPASLAAAAPESQSDGEAPYVLTCSRLDAPKRIDRLIAAMAHVEDNVTLKIAGTGPREAALRALAGGNRRIVFLGFVSDSDLAALYAGALAVLFIPKDEDYGLIAIEAMASGTPVVTAHDSGGPQELIWDGENGLSVAPEPTAIAAAVNRLARDPALARRMGEAARATAAAITWPRVIDALLTPDARARARPSLCVAAPFAITPPRGGGQSRIFNLYRHLARVFDITIVCIVPYGQDSVDHLIAPGLREIRVPQSEAHHRAESAMTAAVNGVPISDVALPQLIPLTPDFERAFAASAHDAMAVIVSHPYLLSAVRRASSAPLWYEAHNAEITLKRAILPDTPTGRALIEQTRTVEQAACDESALIFACAPEDAAFLSATYGADLAKIVIVPNGADLERAVFTSPADRTAYKADLNARGAFSALFMGSWHQPNIDAIEDIIAFAPACPDVSFLIVGSAGQCFAGRVLPENVGLMNEIDDITLHIVMRSVDCALNPMQSGAGTNLKMLDYFASGIPVISTPHGARGLAAADGAHLIIADLPAFPDSIARLRAESGGGARVAAARRLVEERYDWRGIADRFMGALQRRGFLKAAPAQTQDPL